MLPFLNQQEENDFRKYFIISGSNSQRLYLQSDLLPIVLQSPAGPQT